MSGSLAENLMACSVGSSAYGSRPLEIGDIDEHPDSGRIWATIAILQENQFSADEEAREEAGEDAIKDYKEAVAIDFEKLFDTFDVEVTMKDGDTQLFHMKPRQQHKPSQHDEDLDYLELETNLERFLDRISSEVAEVLGDAGRDLAELRAQQAKDRKAHAENVARLKDYVSAASADAKMEHYDRRVLRSGRPDEKLLSRLRKEDLVKITAVALALAYGRTPR